MIILRTAVPDDDIIVVLAFYSNNNSNNIENGDEEDFRTNGLRQKPSQRPSTRLK